MTAKSLKTRVQALERRHLAPGQLPIVLEDGPEAREQAARLREGGRHVILITPGTDPIGALVEEFAP